LVPTIEPIILLIQYHCNNKIGGRVYLETPMEMPGELRKIIMSTIAKLIDLNKKKAMANITSQKLTIGLPRNPANLKSQAILKNIFVVSDIRMCGKNLVSCPGAMSKPNIIQSEKI
jgi:hypothetical protein